MNKKVSPGNCFILVLCEESGRVTKAFRKRGFKIRDPKMRSKTFPGIAEAMAEQWGKYILERKRNE